MADPITFTTEEPQPPITVQCRLLVGMHSETTRDATPADLAALPDDVLAAAGLCRLAGTVSESLAAYIADQLATAERERDELRSALRDCLSALGNGGALSESASSDFHALVAEEVRLTVKRLESERDALRSELLAAHRDGVELGKSSYTADMAGLVSELQEARAALDEVKVERDALRGEVERLKEEQSSLYARLLNERDIARAAESRAARLQTALGHWVAARNRYATAAAGADATAALATLSDVANALARHVEQPAEPAPIREGQPATGGKEWSCAKCGGRAVATVPNPQCPFCEVERMPTPEESRACRRLAGLERPATGGEYPVTPLEFVQKVAADELPGVSVGPRQQRIARAVLEKNAPPPEASPSGTGPRATLLERAAQLLRELDDAAVSISWRNDQWRVRWQNWLTDDSLTRCAANRAGAGRAG